MAKTSENEVHGGLTNLTSNAADVAVAVAGDSMESDIARRVTGHFARLFEITPGLPSEVGAYVASGHNPSVLSTLGARAVKTAWYNQVGTHPPYRASNLFRSGCEWSGAQMRRLGEVIETLDQIINDWAHFGTKKSPEWCARP